MHSPLRQKGLKLAAVVALVLAVLLPATAAAKPDPTAKQTGFKLFARTTDAITINRVLCYITSTGEICTATSSSSTAGGGFWPRGTVDQYVFNSGMQLAGIISPNAGFAWAGDTTGAFFFDGRGDLKHGTQLLPIYNTSDPDDKAFVSDPTCSLLDKSGGAGSYGDANVCQAAKVDSLDADSANYNPLLRNKGSASQGDIWYVVSDMNTSLNAGRPHPLGVVVEQRAMGWNFPSGNEDIIYFSYTFYNATAKDCSVYANVRGGATNSSMAKILCDAGKKYNADVQSSFGVTLPSGGYEIDSLFAAFAADMDVGDAAQNYASVNVPFNMGVAWQRDFGRPVGTVFPPGIFSKPFFAGLGFVGVKYLKSPIVNGVPVGLSLYGGNTNGGSFPDPRNVKQLYRYLSGTVDASLGDPVCSFPNPRQVHICYVKTDAPSDVRFQEASGPLVLKPGEFQSIIVAYIFAAPVATGTATTAPCPNSAGCNIGPGNVSIIAGMTSFDTLQKYNGVNPADSIMGFAGYADKNGDLRITQDEITTVKGSLLDKGLVAQAVFNNGFLLPFAPESPDFFVIPGDNQVTVLWRPSASETDGDPFFQIAKNATVIPPGGGAPVPNPLYDPNYRQFDVEGYRVYRGRTDSPNDLTLLAQYDYSGTSMKDYAGQVNPVATCAPELSIRTTCSTSVFDSVGPGLARTRSVSVPLVGDIVQVKLFQRAKLADGTAILLTSDTTLTGGNSPYPSLKDNAVPFVFVDNGVRNSFRYFYSVTAFDINSFQSGPASLESPRSVKPVTPVAPASNYKNFGTTVSQIVGRSVVLNSTAPDPTLDAAKGWFSGPFPAANAWTLGFGDFVSSVLLDTQGQTGNFSVTLDSISLGAAMDNIAGAYWYTATSASDTSKFALSILQAQTNGDASAARQFPAVAIDNSLASRYGGNSSYKLQGKVSQTLAGGYYTSIYGRGCVNGADGYAATGTTGCEYNGPRWFDGPSPAKNEVDADPINGQAVNFSGDSVNFNIRPYTNAGYLTGINKAGALGAIYNAQSYNTIQNTWRQFEGGMGLAQRSADFNVYWGAGGVIDSVIDVTHNVVVPFDSLKMGGSWGLLTSATAAPGYDTKAAISATDFTCVEPFRSLAGIGVATGVAPCPAGQRSFLTRQAALSDIILFSVSSTQARTAPVIPARGFGFYLAGNTFTFDVGAGGALPAAGTVWSMRSYVGAISGGKGRAGDRGPYTFFPVARTMSAVGAQLQVAYSVTNQLVAASNGDLSKVHTVPDPYYVTSSFEQTTDNKVIKFVNLPNNAIIRIYSSSGVLVQIIEHNSTTGSGEENWNVRNRNNQVVASGVYFYHIESGGARRVGRFTVVNFAQ